MSDTPTETSQRQSGFIAGAAIAQSLMVPYLVLAGLMAAEVSGAAAILCALFAGRPAIAAPPALAAG
ncbi:hypothetical protein BHS06_18755 [Myxococcus xanthus]|uniref:hypothetical protein n=1 Tax=Myxococcus xanthus TaxID=34 RepID=UPI00112AD122|nr:hypothetical protein [Myxococcus xanthus]QDE90839.1 hypothetical protein BHS06_18755 [Myxococcus xanthus]